MVYSQGVARLTKDLSGGVIQGSDVGGLCWFSGQGEGKEIDVKAVQEVLLAFSFHENEGVSKNFSQHCTLWELQVCKVSQPKPTPSALQRSLSAECSGTNKLKAFPSGLLFFSSALRCRTYCPALSNQDTNQCGLVKQESFGGFLWERNQNRECQEGHMMQMCQCLEHTVSSSLPLGLYCVICLTGVVTTKHVQDKMQVIFEPFYREAIFPLENFAILLKMYLFIKLGVFLHNNIMFLGLMTINTSPLQRLKTSSEI